MRLAFLLLCIAGLGLLQFVSGQNAASSEPAPLAPAWLVPAWHEYTYQEALAAGLVNAAEFARAPGEPLCGPLPPVVPTAPDDIPDNAPTCYRPPEEQGAIF